MVRGIGDGFALLLDSALERRARFLELSEPGERGPGRLTVWKRHGNGMPEEPPFGRELESASATRVAPNESEDVMETTKLDQQPC